jgi:hypothetical protein
MSSTQFWNHQAVDDVDALRIWAQFFAVMFPLFRAISAVAVVPYPFWICSFRGTPKKRIKKAQGWPKGCWFSSNVGAKPVKMPNVVRYQ